MNRTQEAEKLADEIIGYGDYSKLSPDQLATLVETFPLDWAQIAALAGTELPDTTTQILVAHNLRARPARHLAVAR